MDETQKFLIKSYYFQEINDNCSVTIEIMKGTKTCNENQIFSLMVFKVLMFLSAQQWVGMQGSA